MKKSNKKESSYSIFSKKQIEKYQKKIELLGKDAKFDANFFLNMRLFSSIILFIVVLYLFEIGYFLAPIIAFIYYNLCYYLLIERNIKKRAVKLEHQAIYFFEVFTLALESGNNLEKALEITCNNVDNDLSQEFQKAIEDNKYGNSFNDTLVKLEKKIPSDIINNIILNMVQANILGNSIKNDIYNQIDYIRDKELQEIKGKMSKIPLQVSVISVIFYIPLIMLLILSPVIINFLN